MRAVASTYRGANRVETLRFHGERSPGRESGAEAGPGNGARGGGVGLDMKNLLIFLLVLWLVVAVIGFVIETLVWLAVIGLVLFALTTIYWFVRGKKSRGSRANP